MRLVTLTTLAGIVTSPPALFGQMTRVEADPNMPTKTGFDTGRAVFWETPNFVPLRDPTWRPLAEVHRAREVTDGMPVVVFEAGGKTLVLVSSQMAYHHVAQGDMNGEAWMVTF